MGEKLRFRVAKFADIPGLLDLMAVAHFASNLAGRCQIDEQHAEKVLRQVIGAQSMKGAEGTTFAYIAVTKTGQPQIEVVQGAILGVLQRIYFITDRLEATDVFWYVRPQANALIAKTLLNAFHSWAARVDGVIDIVQSELDMIAGTKPIGPLLERKGFRRAGTVYIKEIEA